MALHPLNDNHEPVQMGPLGVPGRLTVMPQARALVVFAHGSGSSHKSPRNRYVAEMLRTEGLATLLFDLLTIEEADDRRKVFDIELLAQRLQQAMQWVREQPALATLPLGIFGASTGAAAALVAAARQRPPVGAVVSRGISMSLRQRLEAVAHVCKVF